MTTWAEPRQLALLADPLDVRFAEYVAAHPWFLPRLAELARGWKSRGFAHMSVDMLFHQLRIEVWQAEGNDSFKVNNSYSSRAARALMTNYPDLIGFFHTRQLKGDAA